MNTSDSKKAEREAKHKLYGTVIGIVTDNQDPEGLYRVRVKFPWQQGTDADDASAWYRVASMMGGKNRGGFFLPEVDDEVLVLFEHGEISKGYIIGALWNGEDTAPYSNSGDNSGGKGDVQTAKAAAKAGSYSGSPAPNWDTTSDFVGKVDKDKNDLRFIRSRTFHQLAFNDNDKAARVALSSGQKHRIVLDDSNGEPTRIEIFDGTEKNYILIDSKNKRIEIGSLDDGGEILIKAKKRVRIECETFELETDKDTTEKVHGNYSLDIDKTLKIHSSDTSDYKCDKEMSLAGDKIQLNKDKS